MSPLLAHRLLILLATGAIAVAASGCRAPFIMWTIAAELEGSGYKWKRVAPGTVHAAEEGRPVRFAVITYRTRGDLTGLRSERLVEQCAAGGGGGRRGRPALLAGRAATDRQEPARRD